MAIKGDTSGAEVVPLSTASKAKLADSVDDIFDAPEQGKSSIQVFNDLSKDIPDNEKPAFEEAFKQVWGNVHDVDPNEVVTSSEESKTRAATSEEDALANAAKESDTPTVSQPKGAVEPVETVPNEGTTPPAPTDAQTIESLLQQPITTRISGSGGRMTTKTVPVEFKNPDDQLAYLYKHGDDETRPLIAKELVERGVPTDKIQEYADSVAKSVSGNVNALKHAVTISDRGFGVAKPKVKPEKSGNPLRKPKNPKA